MDYREMVKLPKNTLQIRTSTSNFQGDIKFHKSTLNRK